MQSPQLRVAPQCRTCCNCQGTSPPGLLKYDLKSSRELPASNVYLFPPIWLRCLSPPFITVDFTPPITRYYVSTAVFTVHKPCWNVVSILCQTQIVVRANSCLHCFLHQIDICSYGPSKDSPLCCQNSKRILNGSPSS